MDEITIQTIRQLISGLKCPLCGHIYQNVSIRVLTREGNIWFINVYCSSCGSRNLVAAIVDKDSEEDVSRISDLTFEEYKRFAGSPAISDSDVLNIHYFLEDFDGNFKSLFNSP